MTRRTSIIIHSEGPVGDCRRPVRVLELTIARWGFVIVIG
jgi:hypothetical protein